MAIDVRHRLATLADAHALAAALRPEDVAELDAWGSTPLESLVRGLQVSIDCFALELGGQLACMWGVTAAPGWLGATALGGIRCAWLLAGQLLDDRRYHRAFARESKRVTRAVVDRWGRVSNAVDARNHRARAWLTWLGATWPQRLDVRGHEFHVFILGGTYV